MNEWIKREKEGAFLSANVALNFIADKQRKRKCEENVSDLQKQVLQADLCRIKEETELIKLQKEKVSLEIKKLKYEVSHYSVQTENEV